MISQIKGSHIDYHYSNGTHSYHFILIYTIKYILYTLFCVIFTSTDNFTDMKFSYVSFS